MVLLAFNDSASAELLDKSKFSIVVNGDANLGSGVHVHDGAYIGGDLTYRGANGSYGSDMKILKMLVVRREFRFSS